MKKRYKLKKKNISIALMTILSVTFFINFIASFFSDTILQSTTATAGNLSVDIQDLKVYDALSNSYVIPDNNHDTGIIMSVDSITKFSFNVKNIGLAGINTNLYLSINFNANLNETGAILLYPASMGDQEILDELANKDDSNAIIDLTASDNNTITSSAGDYTGIKAKIDSNRKLDSSLINGTTGVATTLGESSHNYEYKLVFLDSNTVTSLYNDKDIEINIDVEANLHNVTSGGWSDSDNDYFKIKTEVNNTKQFDYTGNIQEYIVPVTGTYKIEAWGASGGDGADGTYTAGLGGAGGYVSGEVYLTAGTVLTIVTGESGANGDPKTGTAVCSGGSGGFGAGGGGGGAWCGASSNAGGAGGGGGLSMVKTSTETLLVAGGGGGGGGGSSTASSSTTTSNCHGGGGNGGPGGGASGIQGSASTIGLCTSGGRGGTQLLGGANGANSTSASQANGSPGGAYYGGYGGGGTTSMTNGNPTTFIGGNGGDGFSSSSAGGSGGGGGGYYGGGGGGQRSSGGGGGSSYTNSSLTNTKNLTGNDTIPTKDGTSTSIGNTGDGYVKITELIIEKISLSVNGSNKITLNLNETYTEQGATLLENGIDISNQLIITGTVDTNTVGTYIITYTYTDSNNKVYTATRTVQVGNSTEKIYDCTNTVQSFVAPITGSYELEVWGAQGGGSAGGNGGYSNGTVTLDAGTKLYIYVGCQGDTVTTNEVTGGFNGGGGTDSAAGTTGGGATDIRIEADSLYARVIVAGGGGGGGWTGINGAQAAGVGGGTSGTAATAGSWSQYAYGLGGTQIEGGSFVGISTGGGGQKGTITAGTFGIGGKGSGSSSGGGGGGGGWYGGGGGLINGGGGGSGWIFTKENYEAGYTSSTYTGGTWLLGSNYYLKNATITAGNYAIPTHDGTNVMTGNTGDGYAKITYLN